MKFLMEMHAHTSETSRCAHVPAERTIEIYKNSEYNGIVITDHFTRYVSDRYGVDTWDEKVTHYLTGYNIALKAAGDDFPVLLGMELCIDEDNNDYLCYGVTEEFLRAHPEIFSLSLKELSALFEENGIFLAQAHPFRRHMTVADWECLKGMEIQNGCIRHDSNNDVAAYWAKKRNLRPLSGSDFHREEDIGGGGIYFNERITSNDELIAALKKGDYTVIEKEVKR
ncbi:MAG: PHP domain-containing protein [Clostridiales bacterium]|nr:PHP domain-containing protein [Clostridiales bacterium]